MYRVETIGAVLVSKLFLSTINPPPKLDLCATTINIFTISGEMLQRNKKGEQKLTLKEIYYRVN